ncbi:hypothetical protein L1887_48026 [Cichorium endivia]|nr:hypothetical protein L1887_48026 [Cichorium endivia]
MIMCKASISTSLLARFHAKSPSSTLLSGSVTAVSGPSASHCEQSAVQAGGPILQCDICIFADLSLRKRGQLYPARVSPRAQCPQSAQPPASAIDWSRPLACMCVAARLARIVTCQGGKKM